MFRPRACWTPRYPEAENDARGYLGGVDQGVRRLWLTVHRTISTSKTQAFITAAIRQKMTPGSTQNRPAGPRQ